MNTLKEENAIIASGRSLLAALWQLAMELSLLTPEQRQMHPSYVAARLHEYMPADLDDFVALRAAKLRSLARRGGLRVVESPVPTSFVFLS